MLACDFTSEFLEATVYASPGAGLRTKRPHNHYLRISERRSPMDRNQGPELFFGLVGAVGADLETVAEILQRALEKVAYSSRIIRVIKELHQIHGYDNLPVSPLQERYRADMDAGDEFRQKLDLGDALARLSIVSIREKHRKPMSSERRGDQPIPRCAYILRSLKHPDEVTTLRNVYGCNFHLISAYAPRTVRVENLVNRIATSNHDSQKDKYRVDAERLIQRDIDDTEKKYGQKVRDTFPKADVFIDASDPEKITESIERFVELLFGNTFHTPTRSEYAMIHAQAAALRSAALGRQVGAAISTADGDIIAVGTNEVPKFGGGSYWTGDEEDKRDYRLGYDISDQMKRESIAEILKIFKNNDWFRGGEYQDKDVDELLENALPLLSGARLTNLIEFGRVTHAEMAALLDAARRGVAVKQCVLHTTTFPCHDCAKHIVASGIRKVIYIEPYPKSLASEFHLDSIVVDPATDSPNQVRCEPFVGIAPTIYMRMFEMGTRKSSDGRVIPWVGTKSVPRCAMSHLAYLESETDAVALLSERMDEKGIKPVFP